MFNVWLTVNVWILGNTVGSHRMKGLGGSHDFPEYFEDSEGHRYPMSAVYCFKPAKEE